MEWYSFPIRTVNVFDVCGAGDTFLAALVSEFLTTKDMQRSIDLANRTLSISVENPGTYQLTNDIERIYNERLQKSINILDAFFIEPIDVDKLEFKEEPNYKPTFISRTPTTMEEDCLTDESYNYLGRLIWECIGQYTEKPFFIGSVWRNKYGKTDWQDPHIHSANGVCNLCGC